MISRMERKACLLPWRFSVAIVFTIALTRGEPRLFSQSDEMEAVIQRMEKDGCTTVDPGVRICKSDYKSNGKTVEAISIQPAGDARAPGILLVPGYERTAQDILPLGVRLARHGFAGLAVSQPGFGKSQGPTDFVGPGTIEALKEGYRLLRGQPYVDPSRMGIYGYSRGGMAASLLATELDDLKAAVLGAGVYDFKRLYDDSTLPGVRKNMMAETGMTKEAIRERSSILRMENLKCPVLILHGELDVNVPVAQAKLLRDRLTQLHKDFEIKLFPDKEHSIGAPAGDAALDFFQRRLKGRPSAPGAHP